jgi:two-component system, NarL family, response regulator NreC
MAAKQRILLADDHTVLRAGIRTLLDLEADMEVIGEAEDGLQAIAQANELQLDLVVIDLSMPLMNGVDAIRSPPKPTLTVASPKP